MSQAATIGPVGPTLFRALRPKHWLKNVFVLAPLVFANRADDPVAVARVIGAFVVFCALASAVYLLNDVADREADRRHPRKKRRPIASGELGVVAALWMSAVLGTGGIAGGVLLGRPFLLVCLIYVAQNLLYSFALKRVVIVDVMLVAAGFILRAWAGAAVIGVAMSHWLLLCTGLLALFLGFVKRRQELASLQQGVEPRPILQEYSLPFLDQMIGVVTASTVVAYSLYAFSDEVATKLGTHNLGLTIPFVLFGIFRYLYLVHRRGEGDNPTALVLSDLPLLFDVALWTVTVTLALYAWK